MKKCVVCTRGKGKRICKLHNGEVVCSLCCAKSRNLDCEGCLYYAAAKQYTISKSKKPKTKHFIAEINEEVIDMAKQMAARIKEGRGGKRPSVKEADEVPLEIQQTLMRNFYKKRYERFLDEEIPALDGVTPRQAAEDPRMRPKLLDLMKEHLKGIERHNRNLNLGLDITWVLDELKLPELK